MYIDREYRLSEITCAFGSVFQDGKEATLHLLAFAVFTRETSTTANASQAQGKGKVSFFLRLRNLQLHFRCLLDSHLCLCLRLRRTCDPLFKVTCTPFKAHVHTDAGVKKKTQCACKAQDNSTSVRCSSIELQLTVLNTGPMSRGC